MIAKIAYLTSPAPNRFVLNFKQEDDAETRSFEISKAHLANILIDGTALALRDQFNRVPVSSPTGSTNELEQHGH